MSLVRSQPLEPTCLRAKAGRSASKTDPRGRDTYRGCPCPDGRAANARVCKTRYAGSTPAQDSRSREDAAEQPAVGRCWPRRGADPSRVYLNEVSEHESRWGSCARWGRCGFESRRLPSGGRSSTAERPLAHWVALRGATNTRRQYTPTRDSMASIVQWQDGRLWFS